MPDTQKMIDAVHAYVAAFEAGSADQVLALYAPDATVEDPIGAPIHTGHEAIHAFYTTSMTMGPKLVLQEPVRIAGDYAAFAFSVYLDYQGGAKRIDVIDTFKFNENNEVVEMRAYWGPNNFHDAAGE